MATIPNHDRRPGLRVRHSRELWTGTITQVMTDGYLVEVEPDGLTPDPGRRRFYDGDDFEGVDDALRVAVHHRDQGGLGSGRRPALVDLSPEDRRAERYLTDAAFHHLVHQLLAGMSAEQFTGDDVRDAVLVAEVLQQKRQQRAAGGDPCGKGQTHAQEKRGGDRGDQPESGRPWPGTLPR